MKIYAIFDVGVQSWQPPFFVNHSVYASRFFETLANDKTSDIGRYPEQFCLFEMGEFSEQNGEFTLHLAPISQGLGSQFIKAAEVTNAS